MSKPDYLKLPPEEFIKFLAHKRGGHAYELKQMAMRWLNAERGPNEAKRDTLLRLTGEVRELRAEVEP